VQLVLAAMLAAFLVATAVAVAPPASAEPYNCPPACDSIPASAWVDPAAIPLNAQYGWPALAGLAQTAPAPRFRFEDLCGTPPVPADPRGYAVTERATVVQPAGQWQLQAQIVHWRGETWRGGELVAGVFAAATQALRDCQRTNLLASPSLTVDEPDRLAAVVSGPVILHQYLLANPANSTISELALWSYGPPLTPWPAVADEAILDAMSAPLCTAYLGSCP
jgi:hypothetical protein